MRDDEPDAVYEMLGKTAQQMIASGANPENLSYVLRDEDGTATGLSAPITWDNWKDGFRRSDQTYHRLGFIARFGPKPPRIRVVKGEGGSHRIIVRVR